MYNHYQSQRNYEAIEHEQNASPSEEPKTSPHRPSVPLGEVTDTITQLLKRTFKGFSLDHFDTGDILLVLIILLLLLEGDDIELVITLGLMLLLGLGGARSGPSHQEEQNTTERP